MTITKEYKKGKLSSSTWKSSQSNKESKFAYSRGNENNIGIKETRVTSSTQKYSSMNYKIGKMNMLSMTILHFDPNRSQPFWVLQIQNSFVHTKQEKKNTRRKK